MHATLSYNLHFPRAPHTLPSFRSFVLPVFTLLVLVLLAVRSSARYSAIPASRFLRERHHSAIRQFKCPTLHAVSSAPPRCLLLHQHRCLLSPRASSTRHRCPPQPRTVYRTAAHNHMPQSATGIAARCYLLCNAACVVRCVPYKMSLGLRRPRLRRPLRPLPRTVSRRGGGRTRAEWRAAAAAPLRARAAEQRQNSGRIFEFWRAMTSLNWPRGQGRPATPPTWRGHRHARQTGLR